MAGFRPPQNMPQPVAPWRFSGRRLCGHREARGLSRNDLARVIDKASDTLRFYEYGKNSPSVHTLAVLAAYLYITPNDLFARPGNSPQDEYREGYEAQSRILDTISSKNEGMAAPGQVRRAARNGAQR